MSKSQEPFYYSQLECPICNNINDYGNIRSGSYSETGKDTDFCPTGRVWQNPVYQKYDPLLFFIATCKKCYYSREFASDYKNWKKDTSFKTYRLRHIQEKHSAEITKDGVIKLLGSHIDEKKYPFESAVIKLLLAIRDEQLMERPSNLDQGRFFLRVAWLFRGHTSQSGNENIGAAGLFEKLHKSVYSSHNILPDYDDKVKNIKNLVENDFTMMFENVPAADEYKKRIEQIISEISSTLDPLMKAGSKLLDVFEDAEKALVGGKVDAGEGFHNYPSFKDFLMKAKRLWDEVPLSENGALIKASEYYQKAYETSGQIGQGLQQVQAAYLIAELCRRAANYENASQFFNQVIRLGREMVQRKQLGASDIKYTNKLLEMALDQARLNLKQSEETEK